MEPTLTERLREILELRGDIQARFVNGRERMRLTEMIQWAEIVEEEIRELRAEEVGLLLEEEYGGKCVVVDSKALSAYVRANTPQ